MTIIIITPAPLGSRAGNRVTARRWAGILKALGHRVTLAEQYLGEPCDVLVALHARRSAQAVERFRARFEDAPLVVALTGTDLYEDIDRSPEAKRSLDLASRLVVLQSLGVTALPPPLRSKARVIYQSARAARGRSRKSTRSFDVSILAHLREVKDPFRAGAASRLLPEASRIRILQIGGALSEALAARALEEEAANPRYRWLGELPPREARAFLRRSHLTVLSSLAEGGANVISEALAVSVPLLVSRIPGNVGMLGEDYPGYFRPGDTTGLARLLQSAETDSAFYRSLADACARRAPLVRPDREREAWRNLLQELASQEPSARAQGERSESRSERGGGAPRTDKEPRGVLAASSRRRPERTGATARLQGLQKK